nr:CBN-RIL-2 protein [Haemonchus contortus]
MLRYHKVPFQLRFLRHQHLSRSRPTREEHSHDTSLFLNHGYEEQFSAEVPNHWFLSPTSVENIRSNNTPQQAIRELRSFDDFGLLSAQIIDNNAARTLTEAPFMDKLLSYDAPSIINAGAIPTTADPSELGGSSEASDIEQLEELIDQGYDVSAVLRDLSSVDLQREDYSVAAAVVSKPVVREKSSQRSELNPLPVGKAVEDRSARYEVSLPSSSDHSKTPRFDPDIYRETRASAGEIITAINNQDLASLRCTLTEKKWPDHRSIGAHLDQLFDLIIRDSYDVDEAVMFVQDFAVCNRRGFLHDVNGVRLALRVAHDSGSVEAASEMLRNFRNMFLVKSPVTSKSTAPASILEDFYSALCSLGSMDQVEAVHKVMISLGFDRSSDIFIRSVTHFLMEKSNTSQVFGRWKRLSERYGTTSGVELIWQGLFTSVENPVEQARLAGKLLKHCCQHEHPFAVLSSLVMTLVHLKLLDAAKAVLIKVAIPGRFFKKPLLCVTQNEDSLETIKNFADLVTQCMFSEKRKIKEVKASVEDTPALSPELSSVLNSFCGMGRPKQQKLKPDDSKRKLHRVNDEQLFELSLFMQSLWLEKAEKAGSAHAADRLVSWSMVNKLEIPPHLTQRIVKLKSSARP